MKVMGVAGLKDYNKLAMKGIHFCASCGKHMKKYHFSGHCPNCIRKGLD
jgi:hypothetical protein